MIRQWFANIYQDASGDCHVEVYAGGFEECIREGAMHLRQGDIILALAVPIQEPKVGDL